MSSDVVDEDDAERVRSAIVARYDKGPDGPIEPWEDANFIVYQVCDRYGFLHKKQLPYFERDEKILEIERERAKKWVKMLQNWEKYANVEKLRKRVYKGIPDSVRGEAWKKILGVDAILKESNGVYERFKYLARSSSPDIRQIDLDVNRTYRDHMMFRERFGVKQQALFHVLAAYSLYNVEVGYCQGMSGIAALLLMYMNEEDAFWALCQLLSGKRHCMHGFFVPGFPKLLRFQDHHDTILRKMLPKIDKHLQREGCSTTLYTLKWFMQCFLDRLPFSVVLRIWDVFVFEGDRVLNPMAYGIVKMHKKQFQKWSLEEIAPFLQETMRDYPYSEDEMIELLQESMNELRKVRLDVLPPPTDEETPKIQPGTLQDRGSLLTASKRYRQSRDSKKSDSSHDAGSTSVSQDQLSPVLAPTPDKLSVNSIKQLPQVGESPVVNVKDVIERRNTKSASSPPRRQSDHNVARQAKPRKMSSPDQRKGVNETYPDGYTGKAVEGESRFYAPVPDGFDGNTSSSNGRTSRQAVLNTSQRNYHRRQQGTNETKTKQTWGPDLVRNYPHPSSPPKYEDTHVTESKSRAGSREEEYRRLERIHRDGVKTETRREQRHIPQPDYSEIPSVANGALDNYGNNSGPRSPMDPVTNEAGAYAANQNRPLSRYEGNSEDGLSHHNVLQTTV